VLPIDVLEGLVTGMEDKWLSFEVKTLICQITDYGIKRLVIGVVITLRSIEFLTGISNRPPRLD